MPGIDRRTFIAGAAAGAAVAATSRARAADANSQVVLAIMGVNNRGSQLATGLAKQPTARIAYVCDPDERAIKKGIAAATSNGGPAPKGIRDFREVLDDPAVDGLVVAAPNHWHAPATILACAAGKHVYVEKPCSHSAEEGELMIAAARKAKRTVQVGMQRRSGELYKQVIDKVRGGALGEVLYAKSWYMVDRPSIGKGKETPVPEWLDYSLWQGPAPERPYRDNILHYNWHFFWHWGDGELGNNGVHTIDLCRWALGVDYPSRVTIAGGRLRYDDDQQTPDTVTATYQFGKKLLVWEGLSWSHPYFRRSAIGIELRGEAGTLHVDDGGYTLYDRSSKEIEKHKAGRGDAEHLKDFLDAVRDGHRTAADIEDGHKSALLCHLGNIAYRTGSILETDPSNGHIRNNAEAEKFWRREYRPGWKPTV
jgi:predicted dehydrogenase